jgi:hypothetical protein
MATVLAEMSMSLDGFVAAPSDQVGPLCDWYGNGEVEVRPPSPSGGPSEPWKQARDPARLS